MNGDIVWLLFITQSQSLYWGVYSWCLAVNCKSNKQRQHYFISFYYLEINTVLMQSCSLITQLEACKSLYCLHWRQRSIILIITTIELCQNCWRESKLKNENLGEGHTKLKQWDIIVLFSRDRSDIVASVVSELLSSQAKVNFQNKPLKNSDSDIFLWNSLVYTVLKP